MTKSSRVLRRIALLSIHTSPLHQPGTGDAGGMNVYIAQTAKAIAKRGIAVEIFTRATDATAPDSIEFAPGVTVRHIPAGPFEGLRKEDLPGQLCAVTAGVLRAEAARSEGFYDLIHSHYWLSGQVGWIAQERWGVPLVHTMHTMARVKNLEMSNADSPEPAIREIGEEQVVRVADRLIANTQVEAQQLINLYHAEIDKVRIVHPGVDLEVFRPGDQQQARAKLGIQPEATVLLFVGRIQPLKAPDILIKVAAELLQMHPEQREKLVVAICGGPSGSGFERPEALMELAAQLGVSEVVQFHPPLNREDLTTWYQAATVCVIPSHSESFGLVAIEAQACGTPVVAANVGGLPTAVQQDVSGLLVSGHNPKDWADVVQSVALNAELRNRLSTGAIHHARKFGWDQTTEQLLQVYSEALHVSHHHQPA